MAPAEGPIGADTGRLTNPNFDPFTEELDRVQQALRRSDTDSPGLVGAPYADIDEIVANLPKASLGADLIRLLGAVPQGYQEDLRELGQLLASVEATNADISGGVNTGRHT
ncbi:hypothetical protein FJK98_13940 [Micromonospora sp. HM134]|uniref:hypothetical protein n=1 Tax=unclassified Micromonospora TaxID=2617518 RepID=UPI001198C062|nr:MULTISPECIES: hypothetical protein [unclassified Micromonospora]QDY08122.1 hypothetical protein FJK98_13940 [Micromonospora sp. HM134]